MLCLETGEFLRNDDNKAELFSFLSIETAKIQTKGQIVVTHHKEVLCNWTRDTTGLAPCTQEEADSRIFLHVLDASSHGCNKIMIRTVDTDVLILATTAVQCLKPRIEELWVAFASGKTFRYLPTHEIAGCFLQ